MILLVITSALSLSYVLLILYYRSGWKQQKSFELSDEKQDTMISVIIPARNEEKNIGRLLDSLKAQTYPDSHFEVIVVNDHSSDKTEEIVCTYDKVRLISLKETGINSYKKKAIETGINASSGELIAVTDADCIVHPQWLSTLAAFRKKTNAIFIAAPVMLHHDSSVLQRFQALDFLVLQGITAASVYKKFHNMCNGANLAYDKKIFLEAGGFSGIDQVASGDDMLLMEKINRMYPEGTAYLFSRNAIVTSKAAGTWKEFFNQRIRWASKSTAYRDQRIFLVLLLVYLFNLSLLVLFFAGFWNLILWKGLFVILLLKIIAEYLFIYPVSFFFNQQQLTWFFIPFQPLHIVYTIIAGLLGKFGTYSWKGRWVK